MKPNSKLILLVEAFILTATLTGFIGQVSPNVDNVTAFQVVRATTVRTASGAR